MKNSWKRVAASAVSLVTVAGMLPANVGGILPGGTTIVANAEGSETNPGADNSQNESATDLSVTIDTNSEEELGETLSDDEGKFILSDFETTHEEDPQAEDNKYYISLEKAAADDEEATDKTLKIEKGSGYPGLVIESVSATDEEGNDIGAFLSFDSATGILSMREAASKKVASITITYHEVNVSVTTPPEANNPTYNGNSQKLIDENNPGVASADATIQYAVGENNIDAPTDGWSADIPERTNAGSYHIWYKAVKDNDESTPQCVTNTIFKATPTLDDFNITLPTADDRIYDGNTKSATIEPKNGIEGMGEVTVKYIKDSNFSSPLDSAPKDVGNYMVRFTVAEGDNYNAINTEFYGGEFDIAPANPGVSVTAISDLEYNNESKTLIEVANEHNVTVHYKLSTSTEWTTTPPTATKAGEYTVQWYSDASGNYAASGSADEPNVVTVTINKAADTVSEVPSIVQSYPFDGEEIDLVTNTPSSLHGHIEYSTDGTNWSSDIPKGKAINSYLFYYRASGDGENFKPSEAVQVTASIVSYEPLAEVTEFNNKPAGSAPTLKLTQNVGNLVITRSDGVVDLNGHTVTNLYMRNQGTVTVINGTVSGELDDRGGVTSAYKGNIILGNVNVYKAFTGGRNIYLVGTTNISNRYIEYNKSFVNAGAYGCNTAVNPIAKSGLVYNGKDQLLIENKNLYGLFGSNGVIGDNRYFTYFYSDKANPNNNNYVSGTLSNGVINTECKPLYGLHAGTYTLHYMWDCDSSYIDSTVHNTLHITIAKYMDNKFITAPVAANVTDTEYSDQNVLKYNGNEQQLVGNYASVKAEFGDVLYSVNGGEWSADAPTAKNTGTYVVKYKVKDTDDYNGLENTDTQQFTVSILNDVDLKDNHHEDGIRLNDLVKDVITSISVDFNKNGVYDENEVKTFDEARPAANYYYLNGEKVKIVSKAKLVFTGEAGNDLGLGEAFDSEAYTYEFNVPDDENLITVKREYNYSFNNVENKLFAKDENLAAKYADNKLVATLTSDDFEYLDVLSDHVYLTVEPDYELKNNPSISYKTIDGSPINAPKNIGTYKVTGVVETNGQRYQINDTFEITPRNYATHSGANAVADNKIEATLNFEGNKTIYNKETQTPVVTITDTLRGETKTLVRGTDYELGCINAETGEFEVVAEADDEAKFGAINAGEYKLYVHFIGNYMNKVEGEEKYEEIKWSIVEKELTAADVTAPTAGTLTYNTEDQLLLVNGGGAGRIGVVYYRLGDEGEYTTEIPKAKDAGVYTVYWYVKGDSDHTDYTAANGDDAITVTISPKQITPTIEPSEDTFTYDGNEKKFTTVTVKDGDTVIDASEYEISYESNTNAGENTAKLVVKDAKNNVDAAVGAETTGNYTIIEKTTNFSIAQADATITIAPKTIVYDGASVDLNDFTIEETNGDTDECTLKFYADNEGEKGEELTAAPVNAGAYWVEASVAETTNFNAVTSEAVKFAIAPKNIEGVTITVDEADEPAADGENAKDPAAITVKDTEINKDLVSGTDFTAAYSENINAGQAVVEITGTGNYTGTATANYNVLSVLDISAVKDLITSITYEGQTITDDFADTYNFRTVQNIKVVSQGVLKFGDLIGVATEKTNAGYVYTFAIPAGKNLTTVTHIYNYKTSQTIDTDGVTTIWGTDNNILNNEVEIKLATLHIDPVYYLDDADEKIILTDMNAPSVTLEKSKYEYTKMSETASLVNGKPVNVGKYSVKVRINLTDGDGTEFLHVDKAFDVLPRTYDDKDVKATITTTEYTYSASNITPEVIVTDLKRVDGEQLLKAGTDYTLTGDTTCINAGEYNIDVNFIGNYGGTKRLSWKIDPKNIESDDISITYPRVSVLESTGWTKCDPIVITDNGKTLAEGTDYKTYRDTTNRIREGLAVLINGEGNYTGNLYLDWDVINKPEVTLTETGVKDAANKKIWIKVDTNSDNADAIARTGVLIYKLGENMTADGVDEDTMTIENKDALGLVQGSKAGNTYSPSVSNSNTGYGFLIRPYTELVGGTIVYGDIFDTSYEAVACANANASVELSGSGVKNATEKKIWIKVDAAADYEGVVAETGVLIYKLNENRIASDVNPENMTIENKDVLGLVQGKKSSNTYSPSVSNGDNGFVLRTYTKLVDGSVVYGDLVETSYAEVASATANAAVEISNIGVKDVANKKIWIKVDATADNADAVAKTGVLIYKLDGNKKAEDVNEDNMTVESKDTLGLVQGSKAGNTYSPSVSNGDNGFVLRSYTELIDGSYVYGELITTSYAEVAAE